MTKPVCTPYLFIILLLICKYRQQQNQFSKIIYPSVYGTSILLISGFNLRRPKTGYCEWSRDRSGNRPGLNPEDLKVMEAALSDRRPSPVPPIAVGMFPPISILAVQAKTEQRKKNKIYEFKLFSTRIAQQTCHMNIHYPSKKMREQRK